MWPAAQRLLQQVGAARRQHVVRGVVRTSAVCAVTMMVRPAAHADSGKGKPSDGKFDFSQLVDPDQLVPNAESIGFGTVCGFASGFFAKKVGQVAVLTAGGLFTLFQVAAYYDIITINWDKLQGGVMGTLDLDKDGDFDHDDMKLGVQKAIAILSNHMPATTTGFGAGFLLGLKRG
ncbi:FUN14 domain-containing protein 1 [Porphyridium purpureum]|uniref:FUN14 domain-containing protein 1 n=1 Tax=Porphyridium purpureum TaxID=35688 RepID=A0A5J4YZF5_PORPP|nr:FUN14 domain-containing protein 1 [Porphyridium purpureum]|eukprot:POR8795..scf209_3